MLASLGAGVVLALALVAGVAGIVTGIAGFGFALLATAAAATVLPPGEAVVLLILPILGVNVSLVRELDAGDLRDCGRRFRPFLTAALLGTVVGMGALQYVPAAPLAVALGLLSLGFVATAQDAVDLPFESTARERCFVETTPAMAGVGAVSGTLFGATNVGVQLIAYLRSCDLPHRVFVGVVAMIFLGINGLRVVAAGVLGLYPSPAFVVLSVLLVVPTVLGAAIGRRLRHRLSAVGTRRLVLALLTVVGVRLVLRGLGIARVTPGRGARGGSAA